MCGYLTATNYETELEARSALDLCLSEGYPAAIGNTPDGGWVVTQCSEHITLCGELCAVYGTVEEARAVYATLTAFFAYIHQTWAGKYEVWYRATSDPDLAQWHYKVRLAAAYRP